LLESKAGPMKVGKIPSRDRKAKMSEEFRLCFKVILGHCFTAIAANYQS